MDDFEQKLNTLLSNPEQLQGILSLAKSLGLGAPPGEGSPGPDPPPQTEPAPAVDEPNHEAEHTAPASAAAILPPQPIDRRQENLIAALKPFLKPEKRKKIDRAMQLARLTHLAEYALRSTQELP